jgi:hypothetical protein
MATGSFKLPIGGASDAWVRPSDWLTMPTIGTQEFIGLLAITDDESNHIALTCQGAYTVDWGDGVTENVATNVKAQHTYTYSAISSGTLTTRGYKQVLVRVTPQAGQNLTKVDLQQQNSIVAKVHTVSWLDIAIKGSNITTLTLGGSTVNIFMCENVDIYSFGAITNLSLLFYQMYALQKFTLPSTASVNNFSAILSNCISIKKIPLINTISGTNFSDMVSNCYSLKEVPLFNTVAGTNFSNMFQNCYSIQSIPLFNTAAGTNFSQMLRTCYSLQQAPNLNTALGTNFSNMMLTSASIAKGAFQGTRYSISYSGFCLSQSAIVDIFNGLGTAVGTQTINVSSNPGRAALTAGEILIATAKGWTVV